MWRMCIWYGLHESCIADIDFLSICHYLPKSYFCLTAGRYVMCVAISIFQDSFRSLGTYTLYSIWKLNALSPCELNFKTSVEFKVQKYETIVYSNNKDCTFVFLEKRHYQHWQKQTNKHSLSIEMVYCFCLFCFVLFLFLFFYEWNKREKSNEDR